jgi:hypothetical protein
MVEAARPLFASSLILALFACGKRAPAPAPQPASGPAPADAAVVEEARPARGSGERSGKLRRDCNALFDAWLDEIADESGEPDPEYVAEIEQQAGRFECDLRLDLDGDTRDEHVFITSDESLKLVGIGIEWGDGHSSVLGAGNVVEIHPYGEDAGDEVLREKSYDWIQHWEPAPLRNGAFEVRVLQRTVRFDAPGAIGDGIKISGTDAAAVFYFDGKGWRWIHLGF